MDTQRLVLLLVFSFSLVMLWEGWQKQHRPQPAPIATEAGVDSATKAAPTPTQALSAAPGVPGAGAEPATAPKTAEVVTIRTDALVAEVSAQGGDIVKLELARHKVTGHDNQNFVLLDSGKKHVYQAQSGLIGAGLPTHKELLTIEAGERELKPGQDELTLRLTAPPKDGVQVTKVLTFKRGSYEIAVAYEIRNGSTAEIAPYAYFQLVRDGKAPEAETKMLSTFTGPAVYTDEEKYQKISFEDVDKGKAKHAQKANNGWIGIVQHYFVAAWLPQGRGEREFFTRKLADDLYAAGVIVPVASIPAGGEGRISVPLYAGPQEQQKLSELAPGLDLVVDYGWLTVIAAPIFWVLGWLHKLVGNWGWAIILLTVLIKLIFFPLSAASYKSMARMKVLTPRLMKLKEQYGNDRARLNQEMMELYKKEKINPLGGCLPILVQIPVFIALYWVLLASVEMRNAPWILWIQDLSAKDPYFVLPLVMGASMFIQTKLNPTPPDPIQAKVMLAMPIVFTGMFLFFPSGLVLYWVVNNVLSIAQQWQITRMIEGGKTKAAS